MAANPRSTTSVAASPLPLADSTPPVRDNHNKKQQQDNDEDPHAPPLLPLADKQLSALLELSGSRSRNRTHSDVSEAPAVAYPDYIPDVPQKNGQEGSNHLQLLQQHPGVLPLHRIYSDIAQALNRAQAQVGDQQNFDFWNKMRQHNLVLWLDYTEEATSNHTLGGSVKHRRTFSADSCNIVQSVAIDPIRPNCRFSQTQASLMNSGIWYDPQSLDLAHWLCDSFADHIAPTSFIMLSYMGEWALAATSALAGQRPMFLTAASSLFQHFRGASFMPYAGFLRRIVPWFARFWRELIYNISIWCTSFPPEGTQS